MRALPLIGICLRPRTPICGMSAQWRESGPGRLVNVPWCRGSIICMALACLVQHGRKGPCRVIPG